jgi:hypothetical protein
MLTLGTTRFMLGCMRLTGKSARNFTNIPDESIDTMFQLFTVIVNNMRASVTMLPYDDHDRVVKLLNSLDCTICGGKVKAILESEKYETLTIDELFSKLKPVEVNHGVTACIGSLTDSRGLALVGGSGAKSNANPSSRMYSLSSLMSLQDEEFDMLGEDELALLTRRFERMHENRVNTRRNSQTCFKCGKPGHFIADCWRRWRTRTTTSTGRGRRTSISRGVITSTTTSTSTSTSTRTRMSGD